MTANPLDVKTITRAFARTVALSGLALAAGLTLSIATALSSGAATYCQAVCKDRASNACLERCNGNDQYKSRAKRSTQPPPMDPPIEVIKDVREADWTITVFDPKGGGGNGGGGGGGGNGR